MAVNKTQIVGIFAFSAFLFFGFLGNKKQAGETEMTEKLVSVDFEVFGIVQGVFFRKHTEKQAKALKLKGWCMNTRDGTVKGTLEGPEKQIDEMKYWLEKVGSPSSRIDKTVFSPAIEVKDYTYKSFSIKR